MSWYDVTARDLPWRRDETTPWGILVSEIMLQQTPVARVLEPWRRWIERWPTPADLAQASPAEVITAWGRLGYPRRSLRLHTCASTIVEHFDGAVPTTYDELLSLPGIGDYTAAAVASFAFGRRVVVLDTNVRRVLARLFQGQQYPGPSVTKAERALATTLLPDTANAPRWASASMELGAVVCTARVPQCDRCPVTTSCSWQAQGKPAGAAPRKQSYEGTDRQCRGKILSQLREHHTIATTAISGLAPADQLERCLTSLIVDGLIVRSGGYLTLPSTIPALSRD